MSDERLNSLLAAMAGRCKRLNKGRCNSGELPLMKSQPESPIGQLILNQSLGYSCKPQERETCESWAGIVGSSSRETERIFALTAEPHRKQG